MLPIENRQLKLLKILVIDPIMNGALRTAPSANQWPMFRPETTLPNSFSQKKKTYNSITGLEKYLVSEPTKGNLQLHEVHERVLVAQYAAK